MSKGKIEHHSVVETVRTYKENRADITKKEVINRVGLSNDKSVNIVDF